MTFYNIALPIVMYLVVAVVAFLLGRGIWKEIREAIKKDEKENSGKHLKGKLKEYGIVAAVGIVALVTVLMMKGGPLKDFSYKLWGYEPQPTIESPFFGDFDK